MKKLLLILLCLVCTSFAFASCSVGNPYDWVNANPPSSSNEEPTDPETPVDPETPTDPETPVDPEEPEDVDNPSDPNNDKNWTDWVPIP